MDHLCCLAFAYVHCCLVVTCRKSADLLAPFMMFKCVFVTFPCGILGQVWYLIVWILILPPYLFVENRAELFLTAVNSIVFAVAYK